MLNEKIIETLTPLGVPVAFMNYEGNADSYCMFQVYNEQDTDFADDENGAVTSFVDLAFYFKSPADGDKAAEIKRLMKQAGFIFDGGQDVYINDTYGKKFDFIFVEYLEEQS
jgi:hypothetical protein